MGLTRRDFGALAAGSLAALMAPGEAEAAAPSTAVFAGACDCHVHIIGPSDKYPMVANRPYTPPQASVAQLLALRKRLGIARNVLVQPSFYGIDNSCMLDALAELGDSARGIAVVAPTIPEQELRSMHDKGVRGLRINLESRGVRDANLAARLLQTLAAKVAPLGWHLQIYTVIPVIAQLTSVIADLPVPVVIDHFGLPDVVEATRQTGFLALLDLARARKIYVKLSAPYRFSKKPDYSDVTTIAQSLIYARRDHMLWATDWPHTRTIPGRKPDEITPFSRIDDNAVLRLFNSWYPDETTRKMILVDNPAKLYGFPALA